MPKRHYSDETKAEALAMLEANGGNVAKTARESGVPESTLRNWRDGIGAPPTNIGAQKKLSLLDLLETRIREALSISVPGDAKLRDLSIYIGVLADKYQLLRGGATQRIGFDDGLDGKTDPEIEAVIREAEDILSQAASGGTALSEGEDQAGPPPFD